MLSYNKLLLFFIGYFSGCFVIKFKEEGNDILFGQCLKALCVLNLINLILSIRFIINVTSLECLMMMMVF